jgi:hypothetical protein
MILNRGYYWSSIELLRMAKISGYGWSIRSSLFCGEESLLFLALPGIRENSATMATRNHSPNAVTGRKSLTPLFRQIRKTLPKKDLWDKAEIIAKWLIALITAIAAVGIPIVVAIIGGKIQHAVTSQTGKIQQSIAEQNTGKDYMQIALNILEKKDLPEEMQKNRGLRKWAVGLLKYYSPVKLDEPTADQLASGEVEIPVMIYNSQAQPWLDASNLNNPRIRRGPHGGPFASVTKDGVLTVEGLYTDQTQIKSPKALCFSEDGKYLIVFNDQAFALYFTELDTIRGQKHVVPPIRRSPRG